MPTGKISKTQTLHLSSVVNTQDNGYSATKPSTRYFFLFFILLFKAGRTMQIAEKFEPFCITKDRTNSPEQTEF